MFMFAMLCLLCYGLLCFAVLCICFAMFMFCYVYVLFMYRTLETLFLVTSKGIKDMLYANILENAFVMFMFDMYIFVIFMFVMYMAQYVSVLFVFKG